MDTVMRSIVALLLFSAAAFGQPVFPDGSGDYVLGPEFQRQPGIPAGTVHAFTFTKSKVYPGRVHQWWLYVPAGYDRKKPLPVMVFLDGTSFLNKTSSLPTVLDNLIAKRELPMMAALFVMYGQVFPKASDGSPLPVEIFRGMEYGRQNGDQAKFLTEEIFPQTRKYVKITSDPTGRGIAGGSASSGGAFWSVWERPDQFGKMFTLVGPYRTARNYSYPEMVSRSERKPIRIFLQSADQDPLVDANRELAAALEAKGYDCKLEIGRGGHGSKHGITIVPDILRWLWRDYPK